MKQFLSFFVILAICCTFLSPAAFAEEEPKTTIEPIFEDLTENQSQALTDEDYLTTFKADSLKITAKEKFKALYIVWNVIPESYTVTANGKSENYQGDFLHKLIKLDDYIDSIEISCGREEEICQIYLFRDYNFPDFVQQWESPCKQADLMVLSAHADDEYLMFGGTIPYYAKERGLQVQVVYLTAHPDEQPRPHELLDGLWTAGVKNYPVIGIINDIPATPIWTISEAASLYDLEAVKEWFTEQLRRFKPSVLVTHDLKGEYGHGAHKLAAKTATEAIELAGSSENYPDSAQKYGVWEVPKTYLHFWQENAIEMDWEIPLESFGGITAREAAELCYQCHKSQHKYNYTVGYKEKWDCRQFGLYRTLVGNDTKADFMDNITPIKIEETAPETNETSTAPNPSLQATTPSDTSLQATTSSPDEAASDLPITSSPTEASSSSESLNSLLKLTPILIAVLALALIALIVVNVKNKKGK